MASCLGDGDADMFKAGTDLLAKDPAARAIFTHDGQPLVAGDRLVQPDLASALETIAKGGPQGFYSGSDRNRDWPLPARPVAA